MMKKTLVVIVALGLMALVPLTAAGAQEIEVEVELGALGDAIDAFGTAVEGGDLAEIATAYDNVTAAFEALAAADPDGVLDTTGFVAAWEALGAAIEGGDLDAIAAAAGDVEAAYADLVDQAAAAGQPADTTTTAAPAGGVATGAGGTAGSDTLPIGFLAAAGAIALLLGGLFALRLRSDS